MEGEFNIGGYGETASRQEFSRFNWFSSNIYQNEIQKANRTFVKPLSTDPYYFHITKQPQWIKLLSTKIWGKVKVKAYDTNGAETTLEDADHWTVVNNIYHALFSSVKIKINGNELEDTASNQHFWKSYLQNKLNIPQSYKENVMAHNNAWIPDDIGKGDKLDRNVNKKYLSELSADFDEQAKKVNITLGQKNPNYNSAWDKKRRGISNGGSNPFEITLYHDLMTSGKSFPPQTEFEITLERTPDKFLFIYDPAVMTKTLKMDLSDIELSYDWEIVTPEVDQFFRSKLKNSAPSTTIKKNFIKSYVVPSGISDLSRSSFFYSAYNALPEQILIFFLDQDIHDGLLKSNPYCFKQPEFIEAGLIVNNMHEPTKFLENYTDMGKQRMYSHFLDNIGYGDDNIYGEVPISYADYFSNSFMLAFDRTVAKHNGYYTTVPDTGFIDLHLKLRTPTAKNTVVMVYASYSENMKIDGDRVVFTPIETPTS